MTQNDLTKGITQLCSTKPAAFHAPQSNSHRGLPGATFATALAQQAVIPFINDFLDGIVSTAVATDEMSQSAPSPELWPCSTSSLSRSSSP